MSKIIPDKFRYTLYYGDQANVLPNAPDGWLKTTIQYGRSEQYGGVIRSLTLPYTFVRGAATLLRKSYYQQGTPRARFLIDKRNNQWGYDRLFTGKIDFKTKRDRRNGFEVSAIEDNITSKIDAYEDVKYALPLAGDDVFDVTLTPIKLKEAADFIARRREDYSSQNFVGLTLVTNTQLANKASSKQQDYDQVTSPDFATSQNWFYQATLATTWTGKIHLDVNGFDDEGGTHQINIYDQTGTIRATLLEADLNDTLQNFVMDIDVAIPLNEGDRLFLFVRHVDGSDGVDRGFIFSPLTTIKSTYQTQTPSSTSKFILASDLYKRIIAKLDPDAVPQSIMLATEFSRLAYTCSNAILTPQTGNSYNAGDELQIGGTYVVLAAPITYVNEFGIQTEYAVGEYFKAYPGTETFTTEDGGFAQLLLADPQILISLKDFFQDMFALKCGQVALGMSGGRICLEDLSYFYRSGLLTLDLGKNVSGVEITPNTKRQYTAIRVGYEDRQYNALNGSQEAMSQQNYTTPYEDSKLELNAIAANRFDPFGIEEIRAVTANVDGNTASSRSDNDVWGVMLHPNENRPYIVQEGTLSYSGIDGSCYNWEITPSQNLRRGSRFLASCMDRLNGNIVFRGGIKNVNVVTVDLNGNRVDEGVDLVIADLGTKIFRPELFTFTCSQDDASGANLMMRPYGEIRFIDQRVALKGFISEVSTDEGSNSAQKFTLECCGDVDLTKLIR